MSSVRMCDSCGIVFSEQAEGWSTFSGSIRRTDPQTKVVTMVQRTMDKCPDCTQLVMTPVQPQTAIGTSASYVQEALTEHEARYEHPAARQDG